MTLRYVGGALGAIVLSCSVTNIAPVQAQSRDGSLLPPEESGVVTVAGCLQAGGEDGDKYILANPRLGPIASVPDANCNSQVDHRALDVKGGKDEGLNQSMLGHWVEINGRLEKETDDDPANLREIKVRSFRVLPVVPPAPRRAEVAPAPYPRAEEPAFTPAAPPEERPIATTGQVEKTLPHTASPIPLIGLLGLLSTAGGLGLRLFRRHGE